ncbi:Cell cycle checkpoint control protein RAD9A [Anabarilius grahami]|uniref:Cell cycle checkpoint control protein RAD9A n=1 Tax=Anabarilius grahami TaxID=495550 RepID=A0A3N0XLP4_ANAGA|nr:Cell cycle checkpoint control protein RAD9A [Anabarilius grahami]
MKCIIEGNGIKVFGKAVHALSRIGEEIWLDPLEEGLAVRTVNSSQSAYACFFFTPLFFQQYIPDPDTQKDCEAVKCKLNTKCVLPLFRCVSWRERSVDRCEITIKIPDSRVIFQFHCRHGITKTHNLGYQECEALQAVFPAHLCPNVLKAHSKLLGDIVVHFPISQEEVTLSISSLKVALKTFYEEDNSCIKGMNTELMLHPDEFDYFQVGEDSAVTFCLKELRGLLSFAESYGLPVSCHFGVAGQPVSFTVKDMTLEAHVVLSTLTDPDHESPSQSAPGDDCRVTIPKTSTAKISTSEGPMEADVCIADGERVASSQGSEVFHPALHMRKMIQLHAPGEILPRPSLAPESALTTPITPATFKIRSLLFGAVLSDGGDGNTADLPSLVCGSDTEEDGGSEEGHG